MANQGTLLSEQFFLNDLWPGYPLACYGMPADGLLGASHHNVVAPAYPVGTKIQLPTKSITNGIAGVSVLAYLQVGTQDATVIAARSLCGQGSATIWHKVTNLATGIGSVAMTPAAVALSAMTNAYYGWFWVGGNAPEAGPVSGVGYVAAMGGILTYLTDDTVVYGQMVPGVGGGPTTYMRWRVQTAAELAGAAGFCLAATDTAV